MPALTIQIAAELGTLRPGWLPPIHLLLRTPRRYIRPPEHCHLDNTFHGTWVPAGSASLFSTGHQRFHAVHPVSCNARASAPFRSKLASLAKVVRPMQRHRSLGQSRPRLPQVPQLAFGLVSGERKGAACFEVLAPGLQSLPVKQSRRLRRCGRLTLPPQAVPSVRIAQDTRRTCRQRATHSAGPPPARDNQPAPRPGRCSPATPRGPLHAAHHPPHLPLLAATLLATLPRRCSRSPPMPASPPPQAAVASGHRTVANVARDGWRHPVETLAFFGVKPTDTVVELSPGGGWYTGSWRPICASGQFIAAGTTRPPEQLRTPRWPALSAPSWTRCPAVWQGQDDGV